MFKRKNCRNCGERLKESYEFCPSCGTHIKTNSKKEYGMLGKNDFIKEQEMPSIFRGISGGILNKMIGSTMKMLEKEMTKETGDLNKLQKIPRSNIRLMINGREITPNFKEVKKPDKTPKKILPINFSPENLKKFQKLNKKEPKTQIRRLGDKVNYELEVPGVNSINDISITRLENGIEIRAIAKNKAYSKIINVNLPLIKYMLLKDKLLLELDTKN